MKQRKKISNQEGEDIENGAPDEDSWSDDSEHSSSSGSSGDEEAGKASQQQKGSKKQSKNSKAISQEQTEDELFDAYTSWIPLFFLTDIDKPRNLGIFFCLRLFMVMHCCYNFVYPDMYWQSSEIAYNMVFGGVRVPWEWTADNRIRNCLYPLYLSLPLRFLKFIGLDNYWNVYPGMQLAHFVLVFIGDYFFYKVGTKVMGKATARIGLFLYVVSKFLNMHLLKTFGNSVETVMQLVLFNFYWEMGSKFDINVCIVAFMAVTSFMIRCTSPVGWVFLILYKIVCHGSFVPLVLAGFIVAVPTLVFWTCVDSIYYDQFTFVPYNFIYKNLIENVSEMFGVSPPTEYITKTIPNAMDNFYFLYVAAIFYHLYNCIEKQKFPHFFVLSCTFILTFSMIPHKEDRFILPVYPMLILILADFVHFIFSKTSKWLTIIFSLMVGWELLRCITYYSFHERYADALSELMRYDPDPHQIFVSTRFDIPAHSMIHKRPNQVQLFFNPFQGGNFGGYLSNMPGYNGWDYLWQCRDLVESFKNGWYPPKYILIHDFEHHSNNGYTGKQCIKELTEVYDLVREYRTPHKEWGDTFGYYMNEYLMFQRKDSGEKYLAKLN